LVLALVSPLAAAGLIVDSFGAIFIALGLMWKRPAHWFEEAETKAGYNTRLFLGHAVQTADAQVGAALLVLGFIAQLIAASGCAPSWLSLKLAIALACAVGVLAFLFLVAYWRSRNIRRAIAFWLQTVDREEWRLALDNWGARLDNLPPAFILWPRRWGRRSGESFRDYHRRFLGSRRWERLTDGVEPPV
jgi:hypothetical protein